MEQRFSLTDQQKMALKKLGVLLCYLHGSVEEGTAREDSDLDIAVLFEHTPDSIVATTQIIQVLHEFLPERERDIAMLNEASPLLKQIVASTGVLLYARSPDDALLFELSSMQEYEYSRHVVRLGQDLILNHMNS